MNFRKQAKELLDKIIGWPWLAVYDGSSTWSIGTAEDPQDYRVCSVYDRDDDKRDTIKFIAQAPELIATYEQQLAKAEEVIKWYAELSYSDIEYMVNQDMKNNIQDKAEEYFKEVSDD